MKRLKTILQSKLFIGIFLFLLVIRLLEFNIFHEKSFYTPGETIIEGRILSVKNGSDGQTILINGKEKVLGYYYGNKEIKEHDYVKITGILEEPSNNTIPNTFNYKMYLKRQNINLTMNIKDIIVLRESRGIYTIKKYIQRKIHDMPNSPYLEAMILGNTSYLDLESIRAIGISHLFAISGLHVNMLVKILEFLLKRLKRFKKGLIALILFLYAFLVNYSASVLRAVLTYLFKSLDFNISSKLVFFYVLVLVLLFRPWYLFNIGFQYSFLIGFIILFKKQRSNYLIDLLEMSLLSFMASIPITASNFYQINTLSIIWNLFFIPFVSYILYPFLLLSLLIPLFNNLLNFVITFFSFLTSFFAQITFGNVVISKIPFYYWILYYMFFLFFIKKGYKYLVNVIIVIIIILFRPFFDCSSTFYYLDVKQGDSALYIGPGKKYVALIDTGGIVNSKSNSLAGSIRDFLHSLGISKIDSLILSHGDYDHMGEAINLVNNFKVEKVVFNCGEFNELEKELIKVLDKKKIKYYSCIKELNIDNNKLYFLHTKVYDNENDNSNVIYTEIDGYKFMFMGDASVTTEKKIMSIYNLPDIDVLKVGHHGSKTSSGIEFIDKINPKYSIISVGKNNRYGHPNKEVLDNLNNSKIYRTDQDGSVLFNIKNNKLKIETCSP